MDVERMSAHTAVIRLAQVVEDEEILPLKVLFRHLYEDGIKHVEVDFSAAEVICKPLLGVLVLYQVKLADRGGAVKFVNVKNDHLKYVFKMLDLHKVISIEEMD